MAIHAATHFKPSHMLTRLAQHFYNACRLLATAPALQERLTAVLKQLNADAALLKACLSQYTAWIQRQRETATAAGLALSVAPGSIQAAKEHMTEPGPPAGAFAHREAVDAWQRLIYKVITAGNWFLLQVGMNCVGIRTGVKHSARALACF